MGKKFLLSAGISLCAFSGLFAQSDNLFVQKVDSVTINLNKLDISTGILYDRVAPLAGLDLFNAQTDTCNASLFSQAYFEMYYASYNTAPMATPGLSDSMIQDNNISRIVPVGILDYQFNMMDSFAVQNNLFTFQNGLLYDVPGRPQSPYFLKRIQLAALLADSISAGEIKLKWIPAFFKSNISLTVSSISITGLTPSPLSLPLNGDSIVVTLSSPGVKTMQIQVNYSNGQSFTRTCALLVTGSGSSARVNGASDPNDVYWFSSTIPFQGYTEPAAYCGKNQVNVYSRGTDNTLKPIMKPILILDGFDPTNKRDAPIIYEHAFVYYDQNNVRQNFAQELRNSGYDVIIINHPTYNDNIRTRNDPNNLLPYWNTTLPYRRSTVNGGGDYIQRNAMVLIAIIQDINSQLQANGSTEQLIIVGPSMGGQISRYALRYMETHGMNHNCRLWVSFDSPHEGAVLPIGVQRLTTGFKNISKAAKTSLEVQINCPAAMEQLIHHHSSEQEYPTGAVVNGINIKNTYYQEINNLGWPQQCRKIAMISGSDKGKFVAPGLPGFKAIDVDVKIRRYARFLLGGLLGLASNPSVVKGNVYIAPDQQQNRGVVFDGRILFRNLVTRYAVAPSYIGTTIDLVPAGTYPGFSEIKETSDGKWSANFLKNIASQNFNAILSIHSHIPTYSALALGRGPNANPNRKWDDNINTDVTCASTSTKESPFDAYWGPSFNTRHDSLLYGHVTRLRDEFNGIPMLGQPLANLVISGHEGSLGICNNSPSTFTIDIVGASINWSSSPAGKVNLIQTGPSSVMVIPINSPTGTFTLSANVTLCNKTVLIQRVIPFNTAPPHSCSQIGGGPCTIYTCYTGSGSLQLNIPVPNLGNTSSWHWQVSGGVFQGNVTDMYVPANMASYNIVYPDLNTTCIVRVRPVTLCNVESTDEPLKWIIGSYICGRRYTIFPNPAHTMLTVTANETGKPGSSESARIIEGRPAMIPNRISRIQLINASGVVVKDYRPASGSNTAIDVSTLKNGLYILKVSGPDGTEQHKVIIAH